MLDSFYKELGISREELEKAKKQASKDIKDEENISINRSRTTSKSISKDLNNPREMGRKES